MKINTELKRWKVTFKNNKFDEVYLTDQEGKRVYEQNIKKQGLIKIPGLGAVNRFDIDSIIEIEKTRENKLDPKKYCHLRDFVGVMKYKGEDVELIFHQHKRLVNGEIIKEYCTFVADYTEPERMKYKRDRGEKVVKSDQFKRLPKEIIDIINYKKKLRIKAEEEALTDFGKACLATELEPEQSDLPF